MTAHGTAVAPGRRRSLGSMSVAVLVCAAAATLSTSSSVGAVTGHAVTTQEAVVAPIISVTQVPAAISLASALLRDDTLGPQGSARSLLRSPRARLPRHITVRSLRW